LGAVLAILNGRAGSDEIEKTFKKIKNEGEGKKKRDAEKSS